VKAKTKAPQSAILQAVHAAAPAAASSGSGAAPNGSGAIIRLAPSAPSATGSTEIPEQAEANILGKLIALGEEIRAPQKYLGQSAFALFALLRGCRPKIWEGGYLVDIVDTYCRGAPKAKGCINQCLVNGVCCHFNGCLPSGEAQLTPVSERLPLNRANHYIGACLESAAVAADVGRETSISNFYRRKGVIILGTVTDGDCGVDLMCMMIGLEQNPENRRVLREQLGDFLISEATSPWMQDIMAV